jgi:hypothetical protein
MLGIATKVSEGTTALTLKLVVAVAAVYPPEAAWLAWRVTVPAPVSVIVLPEMVAGPLDTE